MVRKTFHEMIIMYYYNYTFLFTFIEDTTIDKPLSVIQQIKNIHIAEKVKPVQQIITNGFTKRDLTCKVKTMNI